MSDPSYDELRAQVAALQAQLRSQTPQPPFAREVSGIAPLHQPDLKTSQSVRPPPLTPALSRATLTRALPRGGKDATTDLIGQIAAIRSLMVSGVEGAAYGDKRTDFRSYTELRQILNGLEEDLAGLLGGGGRIRQIRMTTQSDKGL